MRKVPFSKKVRYTPTWDGNAEAEGKDQFHVVIQVCPMGRLVQVITSMQEAGIDASKPVETDDIDKDSVSSVLGAMKDLLPEYVEVVELVGEDGPITIDDVCSYGAFLPLAAEILGKLAEISSPSEADQGN